MLTYQYYEADTRTYREAAALRSRGDEVDVICLKEPEKETVRNHSGVRLFPLTIGKYRGGSNLIYLIRYVSFFILASLLLTVLYFKRRHHIIQVHTMPDFLVFAAIIPKFLGAKVILDVHELMPELYMSKFGVHEHHWLVRFITWVERRCVAFAHKAIAVHAPHRDTLVKHGSPPGKFRILLNLPDPVIFSCTKNSQEQGNGKFRLIYHGTIAERHGLEVALRALVHARKHISNLEFQVIGEGDDRQRLVRLVDEMGLTDLVKFSEGRVPLEDLPARIRHADVGIVPILYDSFTRFMLPVKLMEYVGLGIPVITARTETIEAYFDETMVRYFQPGDGVELANHIVDLYENAQARKSLASNSRRFNREFSWATQKRKYYGLIDSLLPSKDTG